jgi:hypothetical protein
MGLDWVILDKPKEGYENAYNELKNQIKQLHESNDIDEEHIDNLNDQLKSISISKYETLKCPKVKSSNKSKQYFIDNIYNGIKHRYNNLTVDEVINIYANEYIVELSPYISGISNTASLLCSSCDFRGKGISYSNLIGQELSEEAYLDHTPDEMINYANKLQDKLKEYNKNELNEEQLEDYLFVKRGIKWLKFWGKKGHGYYAWY